MKNMNRLAALVGVLALGLTAAKAQTDNALLDALVKKGVLSDQEAEQIRTTSAKQYSESTTDKILLSNHVSQLRLYGDARYRFEYYDEKPQNLGLATTTGLGGNASTTDRNRYRIRVGADYTFTDKFNAGFELESSSANDSANQTLGDGYGKYSINVGLLYLQYKPFDWATLTAGKQRNPIYTTDLVWDPDINPEGGSETLNWTFDLGGSSAPAMHDSKDMKDMKSMTSDPGHGSDLTLSIGFIGFQGLYADNSENAATPVAGTGVADKTDIWQFVEQVPVQLNWNKQTFLKVVPGFDSYMGGGNSGGAGSIGGPISPAGGGVFGGGDAVAFVGPHATDDLQIFTAPGEFDWQLGKLPFRAYWDFALNTEGKDRIQNVYLGNNNGRTTPGTVTPALPVADAHAQAENADLGDNVAWLAGLQVGVNKKKGDWSLRADYRQVGLGAIDPNLNDSDWGDSFLNQQGVKIQSIYSFTDFLTGSITYYDTWAYKSDLFNGTGGQSITALPVSTQTVGGTNAATGNLAGVHSTQRVDVDLQWKF